MGDDGGAAAEASTRRRRRNPSSSADCDHAGDQADETLIASISGDNHHGSRSPSPDPSAVLERDHVRQIARRWVSDSSSSDVGSTSDQVCRDRLRVRGRLARADVVAKIVRERQAELQDLSRGRAVSGFPYRHRLQALLMRWRILRNGATSGELRRLSPVADRELSQLRQSQPVSGLREEFRYRLGNSSIAQTSSYADAPAGRNADLSRNIQSEMSRDVLATITPDVVSVQLEQTEIVSEMHGTISNVVGLSQESHSQLVSSLNALAPEAGSSEPWNSPEVASLHWPLETRLDPPVNWQEEESSPGTGEAGDEESSHLHQLDEEWHDDESQAAEDNWHGRNSDSLYQNHVPTRLIPGDDDAVYRTELRELIDRRSVTNLLHSDFRENLDRLIRSYIDRSRYSWTAGATMPILNPPGTNEHQNRDEVTQDFAENVEGLLLSPPLPALLPPALPPPPPPPLPPPPPPPPPPLAPLHFPLHSGLHRHSWFRPNTDHFGMEWEAINDLRADVGRLEQAMSQMQRMMEACMDMQLELQRSVRQEVSAALNRFVGGQEQSNANIDDGSKWSQVRKGTCCLCSESPIDSLLYRCGHMCTCSTCATELFQGGGKCPLCRAPIVEVIRAYFIS